MSLKSQQVALVLSGLLALALLGWAVGCVGNFIEDDTLISLRYAARLLEGKGLTWTDGERVEGYSNLSWVLLTAALGAIGLDLIVAVRVLSVLSALLMFGALQHFVRALGGSLLAYAVPALLLASSASLAVWIPGGLEQPLVCACLAVAVAALGPELVASTGSLTASRPGETERLSRQRRYVAAAALGVLVLTRPDTPLFVVLFVLGLALQAWRRRDRQALLGHLLLIGGVPFVFWLLQLGFRLAYYGELLPNTAHIKAQFSEQRLLGGLEYVSRGLRVSWLLSAALALGLLLGLARPLGRGLVAFLSGLWMVWTSYVVLIGGDHFPGYRHLLASQTLAVFLLAAALSFGLPFSLSRRTTGLVLGLAFTLAAVHVTSQRKDPDIAVARIARWQWDGQAVGTTFRRAFAAEQPLWAVTAAGCLPYFSGLPALDLLGLNDAHIARAPSDPRLPLGHDHGDGAYVLERRPDLITFGLPQGGPPNYKAGLEMQQDPRFSREYRRVRFRTLAPISVVSDSYVRLAGKLGFAGELAGAALPSPSGTEPRLIIPAYLLSGALGVPLPSGRMGALLSGAQHSILLPQLPRGAYQLDLGDISATATLSLSVHMEGNARSQGTSLGAIRRLSDRAFFLEHNGSLRLALAVVGPSILLDRIILRRLGDEPKGDEANARRATEHAEQLSFVRFSLGGRHAESLLVRRNLMPREQEHGFGAWKSQGTAFGHGPTRESRYGQGPILGASGPFFNSFSMLRNEHGDVPQGLLVSPPFVVTAGTQIEFSVGGGALDAFASQVGVRLVDVTAPASPERARGAGTLLAFSGQRDETLRPVRVDLTPFAGRTLRIEVFDEASVGWGHVIAADFSLLEPRVE